jgi:lipooligosaccharide transport system permease protein
MVTTLLMPMLARRAERRMAMSIAVAGRNAATARHVGYLWVLLSGFFEPLLYLLSIGVGVGKLITEFHLAGGRVVSYAAFVAPAMLAASAMTGALAEGTFNFFGKMRHQRLYDAVLATPVEPQEIAIGELLWAMLRGAVYAAAFLAIMVGMHLTTATRALLAFPATMLVGFAFGAMGLFVATFVRSWKDFDYLLLVQFALFLFSGTFAPTDRMNLAWRVLVELSPLYHGVALVRGLTTGALSWSMLVNATILAGLTVGGLIGTGRRVRKVLCP